MMLRKNTILASTRLTILCTTPQTEKPMGFLKITSYGGIRWFEAQVLRFSMYWKIDNNAIHHTDPVEKKTAKGVNEPMV